MIRHFKKRKKTSLFGNLKKNVKYVCSNTDDDDDDDVILFRYHTEANLTHRRVTSVDDSHIVCVDVDASSSVDELKANAEMLTAGLSVTQVSVERALDGTVGSRRTG